MTKEEYEQKYIEASKMTRDSFNRHFVALPCKCGQPGCEGWACVSSDKEMIRIHTELYM